MKTANEILAKAESITVINDGQVQYPVLTADLDRWVAGNGPITTANYEQFCSDVECVGEKIATPGNAEMIELCEALIDAGANTERLG